MIAYNGVFAQYRERMVNGDGCSWIGKTNSGVVLGIELRSSPFPWSSPGKKSISNVLKDSRITVFKKNYLKMWK